MKDEPIADGTQTAATLCPEWYPAWSDYMESLDADFEQYERSIHQDGFGAGWTVARRSGLTENEWAIVYRLVSQYILAAEQDHGGADYPSRRTHGDLIEHVMQAWTRERRQHPPAAAPGGRPGSASGGRRMSDVYTMPYGNDRWVRLGDYIELERRAIAVTRMWDALARCQDEFEPEDMTVCGELQDRLDIAIDGLMKLADREMWDRRQAWMRESAEIVLQETEHRQRPPAAPGGSRSEKGE